jgi:hypothetical protein
MAFSYRDLQKFLNTLTDNQLDTDVTVWDNGSGEFLPLDLDYPTVIFDYNVQDEFIPGAAEGSVMLDDGHPYFVI